jgi:CheY-like chemotaxis protein
MATVLIVDDDDNDRMLMRSLLADQGHQIFMAANGEDALRIYLRQSVDVVVTDLQMPRGDGIELISGLKGLDPDVSIVAVSGKSPHKLKVAQVAGARAILEKPITKERLVDAIAIAIAPPEADDA